MNNTLENIVYDSPTGSHVVINTRNKMGKLHRWEWVIRESDLLDYTEWEWKDMKNITDEQIESCEFPEGVEGFFKHDPLDWAD